MSHQHSLYDTDPHFIIDPITRAIKNQTSTKTLVIQHDHNSERFTFELARRVEGHDMAQCNRVEVHYLNAQSAGVYVVEDFQTSPDDDEVVICSWLISNEATQNVGNLAFLLRFSCVTESGMVAYAWHTAVHNGISVSTGMNNGKVIAQEYPYLLAQWEARIKAIEASAFAPEVYVGGGAMPAGCSVQIILDEDEENGGSSLPTHSIRYKLTNCESTKGGVAVAVYEGTAYQDEITIPEGYILDEAVITMGGEDITASAYDDGVISIGSVTGPVAITVTAKVKPITHTVTVYNTHGGTMFAQSRPAEIEEGGTLYLQIVKQSGGNFSINITMGGVDITDTAYTDQSSGSSASSDYGTIRINNVNGNVVITIRPV